MNGAANGLYRAVWRWHFHAGLIFAPILLFMAVTGGVYLFKEPIESLLYRDLRQVPVAGSPLSPSAQIDRVRGHHADARVRSYRPAPGPGRSAEVGILGDRGAATVFVDPYTGRILGTVVARTAPMEVVRDLHEKLLAGRIGNWLVEAAAAWLVILLVSGLFLWWPRPAAAAGAPAPRPSRNGRARWRRWHATTAVWLSLPLLFWALTGLAWTDVWGDAVKALATSRGIGFPQGMFPFEPPQNRPRSQLRTGTVADDAPWAAGNMPVPRSRGEGRPALPVEEILAVARRQGWAEGYTLYFPHDETGVYTLTVLPDDPARSATAHIDQYSGEVLADLRFQDYGWLAKAISTGIAIHEGRYFGWPNLALGLGISLGLIAIVSTGLMMWWRRRPRGGVGAPPPVAGFRPPAWLIGLIVALGVLLPLYGLSLIAVLLLDRLAIRPLKRGTA